ncbi:Uncharacterized protein APZ42_009866 [Daphnia magna]|uniref:BPTI/Kunitz inhibitor domain-containing protein n=1 Tax=Daphnia magna TaxID=35525 RepID=A0A164DQX8_9CRUS|nr:Uncharacterized protein APZ42_009866 [Daphnia magna]
MSKICIVMLCLVGLAMAAPQSAPQARALQLDPVCLLSPIADPTQNCKNVSVRWYFDAVDGDCEDFVYSGCGGSENVFESEFACEVRCENVHDRMNSFESAESAESVEFLRGK